MGETERYVLLPVDESERPMMKKTLVSRENLIYPRAPITFSRRTNINLGKALYAVGTGLNIVFFVISVACLITTGVIIRRSGGFQTSQSLLVETSYNSPVAKELQANWSTVKLTSSHLGNPDAIYRQPPDDVVDAAWAALANPPFIVLSGAEVRDLGKDPAEAARPPEDWGLGPDVYLGTIDVYHQLHCLDMLRSNLRDNFNHYHRGPLSPIARAHVSHCVEALMKTLMCQPSLDILTAKWTESTHGLGPAHLADFDFNRKCLDFEQLQRWTEGRRVDITESMMANLTPPAGTKFQPLPLEVQEALAGVWGE
ncbi:hypothetical protein FHL15_005673 [Xylaria flabelliformis]|uniref:Tat pathway signal sequence n=1 Tax=Xylaria flabelliformis TaxID=2512241 RepID=A0A553HZL6_9PEZI|nr:hypothetical protein FHL15_005673 [Xylaria flabelliformis]